MQINLLPVQPPSVIYKTIALTTLAGLLAIGNLWFVVRWIQHGNEQMLAEQLLTSERAKLPDLQSKASEIQKLLDTAKQSQALDSWSGKRPQFLEELSLFSSLLPAKSYLTSVHYVGTGIYDLEAELPDMESVSTFLRHLQIHPKITGLTVKAATRIEGELKASVSIPLEELLKPQSTPGQWQQIPSQPPGSGQQVPPVQPLPKQTIPSTPVPGQQPGYPSDYGQSKGGSSSLSKVGDKNGTFWAKLNAFLPWHAKKAHAEAPTDNSHSENKAEIQGPANINGTVDISLTLKPPAYQKYKLEVQITLPR
ncbi:PilN domain-containing protein [Effusibacillus lacus]|uniref:Fimbrial assembly protein n=1 Tax=Effusibacillus lacus TaxID=1348429 RepID=A0A292YJD3_9BACL|nr:hypothetical protein [Effusibacillus lacus]TCS74623.1 Tfp pilus assembly protein PilN [Effusibacillus lacus]GAX88494.1 hypothetical protein EFBL_0103 [Effusibacillus lacus]